MSEKHSPSNESEFIKIMALIKAAPTEVLERVNAELSDELKLRRVTILYKNFFTEFCNVFGIKTGGNSNDNSCKESE